MVSSDSQRVFFASPYGSTYFDLTHRYLDAAERQITRIWNGRGISADPLRVETDFQEILIEVHFYFVALRDVYRCLAKVVSVEVFHGLRPEVDNLWLKWFKHYNQGRNMFEHLDERLGEQIVEIEENGVKRRIIFGLSLREGLFRHSNLEWDISKATFDSIKDDVDDILSRIVDKSGAI